MGMRIRLKASADLGGLGSPWYFSGAPDRGWDNDDLHTLDKLKGSDLEVVDTSGLAKPGA